MSLSPKGGKIVLSAELSEKLGLKKNRLNFVQDEDRPQDWYLEATSQSDGIEFKADNANGKKLYCAQSTYLVKKILESTGLQEESFRMIVSETAEGGLYAIITKSSVSLKRKQKENES